MDAIDPDYIDETEIIGVPDTAEDAPETADGEQQENVK